MLHTAANGEIYTSDTRSARALQCEAAAPQASTRPAHSSAASITSVSSVAFVYTCASTVARVPLRLHATPVHLRVNLARCKAFVVQQLLVCSHEFKNLN